MSYHVCGCVREPNRVLRNSLQENNRGFRNFIFVHLYVTKTKASINRKIKGVKCWRAEAV